MAMARTALRRTFAGAYYCCCAMAVLRLMQVAAPGAQAFVAVGGGDGLQRAGSGGRGGTAPRADAAPPDPTARRNKRWSTTFGGNTSSKNSSANNAVRDCNTDSDCLDTPYTSCAIDPSDKKKRCLCADGKQPLNGDCLKKPRGPLFVPALRTSCESDVECLPNAECKNNATSTNPRLKICMCKEGFVEEKEACNYGEMLTFNYAVLLVGVFTTWIWKDHRS